MAIVSIRITSRELQAPLVGMISCNRYIMHKKNMVFNCIEENLFSGFIQVCPVYSMWVKLKWSHRFVYLSNSLSPGFTYKSSCLPSHPYTTFRVATTISKFCHAKRSNRLLNTEKCSSIYVLQKLLNLGVSPLLPVLISVVPSWAEVSSLMSVTHPSGCPPPSQILRTDTQDIGSETQENINKTEQVVADNENTWHSWFDSAL